MNILAPIKSRLAKFDENIQRAHAELEEKQAELERKHAEAAQLQERHNALTFEIDRHADELARADNYFHTFEAQLAGLKTRFLDVWGDENSEFGPNYREIISLEAAIADYPRVRKHIVAKLDAAQATLNAFEREHL